MFIITSDLRVSTVLERSLMSYFHKSAKLRVQKY